MSLCVTVHPHHDTRGSHKVKMSRLEVLLGLDHFSEESWSGFHQLRDTASWRLVIRLVLLNHISLNINVEYRLESLKNKGRENKL